MLISKNVPAKPVPRPPNGAPLFVQWCFIKRRFELRNERLPYIGFQVKGTREHSDANYSTMDFERIFIDLEYIKM